MKLDMNSMEFSDFKCLLISHTTLSLFMRISSIQWIVWDLWKRVSCWQIGHKCQLPKWPSSFVFALFSGIQWPNPFRTMELLCAWGCCRVKCVKLFFGLTFHYVYISLCYIGGEKSVSLAVIYDKIFVRSPFS